MKKYIYLDDKKTPIDNRWIIVRDFYQFIEAVESIGLENIEVISLDHDLGIIPGQEEKTGYDCAKWLVDLSMDKNIHIQVASDVRHVLLGAIPEGSRISVHLFAV